MNPTDNSNPISNPGASGVPTPNPAPISDPTLAQPSVAPAPAPELSIPTPPVALEAPVVSLPTSEAAPVINPVIGPTMNTAPTPEVTPPSLDGLSGGDNLMIDPTMPLTAPEPASQPTPEEVELETPMRAAAPVPGSIGSAISGEPGVISEPGVSTVEVPQQTQSVSFNDPATEAQAPATNGKPAKKGSKTTLIILCVVAALIVAALIGVLVMMLM